MSKTISINGYDFTRYFTPFGYTVSYKKIRGGNEGYMRDGSYTDDVIAVKAVLQATCIPLNDEQLKKITDILLKEEYIIVDYYDTRTGAYKRSVFIAELAPATERGLSPYGTVVWTGASVTLEET